MGRHRQRFIIDNFNEAKIGARYATRLEDIKSKLFRSAPLQPSQGSAITPLASDVDDEIAGFIDRPMPARSKPSRHFF
jgi:hypothetical protein